MGKLIRFIGGAALGAALGAGAAVLFAPQSGKELQARIETRRQQALNAGKTEAAARERELRAELRSRIEARAIKRHALKD